MNNISIKKILVEKKNNSPQNNNDNQGLYYYYELDEWQKDNHFIISGYLKETKSFKNCFKSLFFLHNETFNIYTHLIPSIVFLIFSIYYSINLNLKEIKIRTLDKLNFIQFGISCFFCLFFSSIFHLGKSHSQKVSKLLNKLDYFGIIILITSSLISIVFFAFIQDKKMMLSMICLFLVLALSCTFATFHPQFSTNVYRPIRSILFIIFGLSGLVFIIFELKHNEYNVVREKLGLFWLILEGFFYINGTVIYIARIPERITYGSYMKNFNLKKRTKGYFDIYFNSHQIFHIMVLNAIICHFNSMIGCLNYSYNDNPKFV